jgi:hypothetical protein
LERIGIAKSFNSAVFLTPPVRFLSRCQLFPEKLFQKFYGQVLQIFGYTFVGRSAAPDRATDRTATADTATTSMRISPSRTERGIGVEPRVFSKDVFVIAAAGWSIFFHPYFKKRP